MARRWTARRSRVVEEQPAWQAGSLESLDVIDKVPDVRQVGGGPVRSLLLSPDHSRHKPRPRSPFERNSQTSAHKLLILNILSGGGFPSPEHDSIAARGLI